MAEPTAAQRKMFAKMGIAMPDGSYYVRNAADLQNAIESVGRGEQGGDSGNAIRKFIIGRATKLKLSSKIPATWNPDGSLKHWDLDSYLAHFGVKGQKWGVRRGRGAGSAHPVSADHALATQHRATVKAHGTAALSNDDLKHLVTRLNLEEQHNRLNPKQVSTGQKIVHELLGVGGNVAKQQATTYASKYAAQGVEALIKKGSA
jgi:hypothetical protein